MSGFIERLSGYAESISVTSTSARVARPTEPSTNYYRLDTKSGDAEVFIAAGDNTVVAYAPDGGDYSASQSDPTVPDGGASIYVEIPATATHIAAVTESGAATLRIVPVMPIHTRR